MNNWVDFQSGCGVCKASSDYAKYYGMGGKKKRRGRSRKRTGGGMGQYENVVGSKTMIPMGVSENSANDLYPTQLLSRDNNSQFMNDNLGIDWATTGGAKNKRHKKKTKKKTKNSKRTRQEQAKQNRLNTLKKLVNKIKKHNGVKHNSVNHNHNGVKHNHNGVKHNSVKHNGVKHNNVKHNHNHKAKPKKRTRKKTNQAGGDTNWGATGMPQRYYNAGNNSMVQSGGDTNWGATGMPQRFYDVNGESMNYGRDSGMGVQTAYGKSVPLDVGVGNLAPFNTSRASAPLSMMQTGGMAPLNKDVYDQSQIDINYDRLAGQPISSSQNGGRRRRKHKGGVSMDYRFSDEPVTSNFASVQSSVDNIVSKYDELNASMASFDETLASMLSGGSKKQKTRKCPKSMAKEHRLGKKMRGGDGNVWKVTQDKNKRKRWTKVNKKKKVVRKGASKKKRH